MKFTLARDLERVVRWIDVENGPVYGVLDKRNSLFRVVSVQLEYKMDQYGRWEVCRIDLNGPVLKKDGTDSANTHRRRPPVKYVGDIDEYRWVTDLIDLARPVGHATLPALEG